MNKIPETIDREGHSLSRRTFVQIVRDSAFVLILPQVLACGRFGGNQYPESAADEAAHAAYQFKVFTKEESAAVDALTARIFPSDDLPGAREARVVQFIDHMLATSDATQQTLYRESLKQLRNLCHARFSHHFEELAEAVQDKLLAQMEGREIPEWKEAGDFFSIVRSHTIEGMFSDPKYHGNAARVGWELMGV